MVSVFYYCDNVKEILEWSEQTLALWMWKDAMNFHRLMIY